MKPLLMWGLVPFSLSTLAYDALRHSVNFRHAENARFQRRAATQYIGPGLEEIQITGKLLPLVTGGRNSLELLRMQAETGKAFPLIEGTGRIYGFYLLIDIESDAQRFESTGAPNIIDYALSFKRVGDDQLSLASILTTQINALRGL